MNIRALNTRLVPPQFSDFVFRSKQNIILIEVYYQPKNLISNKIIIKYCMIIYAVE